MSQLAIPPVAELARAQVSALRRLADQAREPLTLMEVCGTHTMAIGRHGLRSLLPAQIRLVSGPGCPVCVTPVGYLDQALALAGQPGTIVATFGDLLRVPGSSASLQAARAAGARIRVIGSTLEALSLAEENPALEVVLLGVGFETTAPTVAVAMRLARERKLVNFSLLSALKTMPAALAALAGEPQSRIDGLLCPGHVAAVSGAAAFRPLAERFGLPCVIAGFEPLDILSGMTMLVRQIVEGRAEVENQYRRVVSEEGNRRARALTGEVFSACRSEWRGLGWLDDSGLALNQGYAAFDAAPRLPAGLAPPRESAECRCGEILTGRAVPVDCPLFARECTPDRPQGACMVSSEGSCAAAYSFAAEGKGQSGG